LNKGKDYCYSLRCCNYDCRTLQPAV